MHEIHREVLSRRPVAAEAWQAAIQKLQPSPSQLDHGLALHQASVPIDTFGFLPMVWSPALAGRLQTLAERGVSGNDWHFRSSVIRQTIAAEDPIAAEEFLDIVRLSGLKGLVQTVAEGKTRDEDFVRIAGFVHLFRGLGHQIGQAATLKQFEALQEQERLAVIWSCNGPPVPGHLRDPDEEFALIDTWRHLGIRLMHLTYNRRNVVGDGCAEVANGGLSDLGRELVGRLNRAGIVVDVPHSGEQTCLDAAATSTKPILASHTGCRRVFEHIRTKSDRVMKAIADTGGAVGIVALATFLGRSGDINALLDHVDYATKLIGTDHVALATDMAYQTPWPQGLKGPAKTSFSSQWWGSWDPKRDHQHLPPGGRDQSLSWTNWPLFTVGLVQRGYRDEDIRKILGGNLLRVLGANEAGAGPAS